jgi:Predicted nucleic acid-binding protein, contains PIN domain
MKQVLVDTSVWSLALRKKEWNEKEQKIVNQLSKLILNLDIVVIGPIRQEILSGISDQKRFIELKSKISIFNDFAIEKRDYELAAQFYNECRKHGIQGSHIDYLICAVAVNNEMSILTLDNDFQQYKKYIKIRIEKNMNVD